MNKYEELCKLDTTHRIEAVAAAIKEAGGNVPRSATSTGLSSEEVRKLMLKDMEVEIQSLDKLRMGGKTIAPVDMSLGLYFRERLGLTAADDLNSPDAVYEMLGITPNSDTIQSLTTYSEGKDYRWIVPEIFREAVRLGLTRQANYRDWIRAEENVAQQQLTMPYIKRSSATVKVLGEMESIPTGSMSFGSKTVKIKKMGIGVNISDEVLRYSAINMLAIFLEDVGVQLAMGLDMMALTTLIQGDAGQDDAIPIIGVATPGTLTYDDMLTVWLRMMRMGNTPAGIIGGEAMVKSIAQLPEFKTPRQQYAQGVNPSGLNAPALDIRTPLPQSQSLWMHGGLEANEAIFINPLQSLIKLNAVALRVESERNPQNQFSSTYLSLTTGFCKIKQDAAVMVDSTLDFATDGFPDYMDVDSVERVIIE